MSQSDIVDFFLAMVRAEFPQCTDGQLEKMDELIRRQWGDERVRVRKTSSRAPGRRPLPDDQRQRILREVGVVDTAELVKKHRVSRATLYRLMKTRTTG